MSAFNSTTTLSIFSKKNLELDACVDRDTTIVCLRTEKKYFNSPNLSIGAKCFVVKFTRYLLKQE